MIDFDNTDKTDLPEELSLNNKAKSNVTDHIGTNGRHSPDIKNGFDDEEVKEDIHGGKGGLLDDTDIFNGPLP